MRSLQLTGQIRSVEVPLRGGGYERIYGLQSGYLFSWAGKYPTVNAVQAPESSVCKKTNRGRRYLQIKFGRRLDGRLITYHFYVHRLIILLFPDICGHFDHFRTQADHINGLKRDNRATNLRTVTPSENVKAAYALRKQQITTIINF